MDIMEKFLSDINSILTSNIFSFNNYTYSRSVVSSNFPSLSSSKSFQNTMGYNNHDYTMGMNTSNVDTNSGGSGGTSAQRAQSISRLLAFLRYHIYM